MNIEWIIATVWIIIGLFNYEVMMPVEHKKEMSVGRIIFCIISTPIITIYYVLKLMFNTK